MTSEEGIVREYKTAAADHVAEHRKKIKTVNRIAEIVEDVMPDPVPLSKRYGLAEKIIQEFPEMVRDVDVLDAATPEASWPAVRCYSRCSREGTHYHRGLCRDCYCVASAQPLPGLLVQEASHAFDRLAEQARLTAGVEIMELKDSEAVREGRRRT